jgi:DNA-directed RNA polymerase specialized sigma subunit
VEQAKAAVKVAAEQGTVPDKETIGVIAMMLGNMYEGSYRSEEVGANVMERVLEQAKKYDPQKGRDFLAYARYHADMAAKGSMADTDDTGRMEAKSTMKGWLKAFQTAKKRVPESMKELADFLNGLGSIQYTLAEVMEVRDAARRGRAISTDASTSGDDGEEDGQTIGDTLTASTSSDENEVAIVQAQSVAALRAATAELNLMERKFLDQHNRGFSVTDIAKRMGISRSTATALKKTIMAHLRRPEAD